MLAIAFGILASVCFAAASLLAQRGLHLVVTPWGAWVTLVANCAFLLAFHFVLYPDASIFAFENLVFVAVGLFVPGMTRVLTFRGIRTMGSAITSTIVNTTPMFSTALADASSGGASRPSGACRSDSHRQRARDPLLGGRATLLEKNGADLSVSCRASVLHERCHGPVGVGEAARPSWPPPSLRLRPPSRSF